MGRGRAIGIAVLLAATPAGSARGQFFKVYEYKTVDAKAVEFSYWTTHIASTTEDAELFGKTRQRDGLWAHAFEVEYGLSHRLTVGAYLDVVDPRGAVARYAQTRLLGRYRLFEKETRPVDLALYLEYYLPDRDYRDEEKIEGRIVVEKDVGPVRLDLNPILEKATSGPGVEEGIEFGYAFGAYWEDAGQGLVSTPHVRLRPGLELYGEFGELRRPRNRRRQKHYVFPTLDLYGFKYFHWNVGVGFGMTGTSDDVIVKSIFSIEILF